MTPTDGTQPRPGRRAVRVVLAAWVFAALIAAGLAYVNHQHDSRDEAVGAARAAAEANLVTLLSYESGSVEAELDDELRLLAGDFRKEYRELMTTQIIPAATKGDVTTRATVVSTSVVKPSRSRVELLVFLNVSTTSSELTAERTSGARLTVDMVKVDGTWRIGEFTPV